ncbi:MAG: hypothetical protein H6R13_680 [Proteobacteria bacterium]|nr:hypothetical protein [Pseudomonadota bacterium]
MAIKPKAKAPAKKLMANTKQGTEQSSDEENTTKARNIMTPTVRGAFTTQAFSRVFGDSDLQSLVNELGNQIDKVKTNDLSRAESLLITQAHTLDAIFNELARRAAMNMGEYIKATDTYLRLAFKAQSQCRATLETLATIKNPPVIFARQANISNGPQQVNNGAPHAPAREEKTIEHNELLEAHHGQRLDTGTTGAAIGTDKELETVGAIDRANYGCREERGKS